MESPSKKARVEEDLKETSSQVLAADSSSISILAEPEEKTQEEESPSEIFTQQLSPCSSFVIDTQPLIQSDSEETEISASSEAEKSKDTSSSSQKSVEGKPKKATQIYFCPISEKTFSVL